MTPALTLVLFTLLMITCSTRAQNSDTDPSNVGNPGTSVGKAKEDPKPAPLADFILSNHNVKKLTYATDNDKWTESFDAKCKTVFIVPGHLTGKSPKYETLANEYLKLDPCFNVVFCDWPSSYDPDYIVAAQSVNDVGGFIGEHILNLYGKLQFTGSIEIVAHGLGAHAAGCAGRTTYDILPLDAIHALSPRGDLFTDGYPAFEDFKLRPSDASRLTCLHTNINGMGSSKECGKFDFFANFGAKQPGIVFEYQGFYSHLRSLDIYTEALTSEAFVARGPLGYPVTRYGRSMPRNTSVGKYYFKTNAEFPRGRD